MIDFEKQIKDARIKKNQVVNEDEFLYKLEMRLQHSKDNRRTLMVSVMMLIAVFTLTITQYGAPNNLDTMFAANDEENILETDFWNINVDSLNDYDSYPPQIPAFKLSDKLKTPYAKYFDGDFNNPLLIMGEKRQIRYALWNSVNFASLNYMLSNSDLNYLFEHSMRKLNEMHICLWRTDQRCNSNWRQLPGRDMQDYKCKDIKANNMNQQLPHACLR